MPEFDYVEDEPIIPVTLQNGENSLFLNFFVDTGADITIIPLSFAKLLGFDTWEDDEIENAQGAGGGTIPYFVRKVVIFIDNKEFEVEIACSLHDDIPFLLGRKGIFDKFRVCFDDREKKVTFTEL